MRGRGGASARSAACGLLVLDTNIALDLLVFDDPGIGGLRLALERESVNWIATAAMRAELQRVLGYPQVARRLAARQLTAERVLCQFDRLSRVAPAAPCAAIRCRDPDDQMFIDLAVAHQAVLLSKDQSVLRLHQRLGAVGAGVQDYL